MLWEGTGTGLWRFRCSGKALGRASGDSGVLGRASGDSGDLGQHWDALLEIPVFWDGTGTGYSPNAATQLVSVIPPTPHTPFTLLLPTPYNISN